MVQHRRSPHPNFYWIIVALVVFLGYALNFLYFFVDDEGIPLVYARHLLEGRGLIYSTLEGPVEGYTDFLHVLLSAMFFGAIRLLRWPTVFVFFIGKGMSLAAGAGCVVLAFLTMRRVRAVDDPGTVGGLAVLALSGPLAVWACSSLETVPFAMLVALLMFALVAATEDPESSRADRLAAVAAVLIALERLDGLLFVAALVGAFFLFGDGRRRTALLRRVALPVVAVLAVYHGWRLWYFGNLLNLPLYAKVLYKLRPHSQLLVKAPAVPYGLRFVQIYGWPAVVLVVVAVAHAILRERHIRPLAAAAVLLTSYVCIVGDWMFGLRFFVALMPIAAVLVAVALSVLFANRPLLAWTTAAVVVAWSGVSALGFERRYESTTNSVSWLREPSFDRTHFFGSYYGLLEEARKHIAPGQRVAYNQAGFIPFMLNLDNVDNLGICSRFYARLPAQDLFFTEVGHYAPLSAHGSIGAEEAYLLYHDVPFVLQPSDLVRGANDGHEPPELMGGYYRLVAHDPLDHDVIYARTDRDASEYKANPHLFFENLAHPAYIQQASVNQGRIAPADFGPAFPFLREAGGDVIADDTYQLDIQFEGEDVEVSELDINQIQSRHQPIAVSLDLMSSAGASQHRLTFDLGAREARAVYERLPDPVKASRLRMRITTTTGKRTRVSISDLRVQGQSPDLARYIRSVLRFPKSDAGS